MNLEPLKEAGLTEGEIKVYLALLEIGSSTTGPVIERSGIAKSIVYQILDKLMQKGLVSVIVKNKTKYFQASEPQKILEFVEEKKSELEKNKEAINEMLPQLIAKQMSSSQSETRMYFGFKGMTTAHEHLYRKLKKGEEFLYLGIPSFQPQTHHLYWQRDHERREEAGLKCRILFNEDTKTSVVKQRDSYKNCRARLMVEKIQTPAMIGIFSDTVTICIQHPEVITIEIVNQHVADSFRAYFEEFWKRSKKV